MKKTGLLIGFSVLLSALLFTFYRMGGFRDIEMEVHDNANVDLTGIRFIGIPQDKRLGDSFEKIEEILLQHPEARLHTIYFREPAGKLDTMEVFVGVERKWLPQEPAGFENLNFSSEKAVVARIRRHRFVMPNPESVKASLTKFAKENNLPGPSRYIDQIISPEEVHVIGILPKGT